MNAECCLEKLIAFKDRFPSRSKSLNESIEDAIEFFNNCKDKDIQKAIQHLYEKYEGGEMIGILHRDSCLQLIAKLSDE